MTMAEELMTIKEVSIYLKVSLRTVSRRIKDKSLKPVFFGPTKRFRRSDVERGRNTGQSKPSTDK